MADLLESLPSEFREERWVHVEPEAADGVLAEANDRVRAALLQNTAPQQVAAAVASLAAWVIGRLETTIEQLVARAVIMPVVAIRFKTTSVLTSRYNLSNNVCYALHRRNNLLQNNNRFKEELAEAFKRGNPWW